MERISRFRAILLLILFITILALFALKLFDLQIIKTNGNTDNIAKYTTVTTVRAARGDILDRNGNVLVGNRASYDLVFNHYVIESYGQTNEALYALVHKCRDLNLSYNDHFPVSKTRPFEYTLNDFATSWQNHFQSFMVDRSLDSDITAPLLIEKLRERGCRITKQRQILLDVILKEECSCCKEIYYKAARRDSKIGMATVYRMMNMLEEIGAVSRRGTYKVSGLPAQDGVCLVELEDNSTITVSMATWNQIVQCGLEACGYTQGQKVKGVVAGQPGDREEEKRWEQL